MSSFPDLEQIGRELVERLKYWSAPDGEGVVAAALDECLARLRAIGPEGRDNQLPSDALWKVAGSLLERGDLQRRARFKPRGYAGDFEMQRDFWLRRECDDPLGRLFDRYFLRQQAVEAVRARMELIGAAIAERLRARGRGAGEDFRVVSVGSGPAIDLRLAAESLGEEERRRLRLTLVDIDEQALDFGRVELRRLVDDGQIRTVRENLFRLARGKRGAELLGGADFIACTGLFDYLNDADAAALLRLFWDSLAPGGTAYGGNFAPHCSTRAYMEWIGNWYLAYRTFDQMTVLGQMAGIPASRRRVAADRTGCDLFLIAAKTA